MATLRIPEEQQDGFKKLAALSDESVKALTLSLEERFPGLNDSETLADIASSATGISSADADAVMRVLTTLYVLRARREALIPAFVEDVAQAMDESDVEGLRLSDEDRARFKDRLAELLNVESVSTESKAIDVQYENDHVFHSARIVTDLRPIFGPNPEDAPVGAVIVHMLRITYRERTRLRNVFVALDTEDVGKLGDVANRADLKAKSLKAFLQGTELPLIDLNNE